jgi:SAM-dependent methyltransferase
MKKLYDREYFNKGYMKFYGEQREDCAFQSNEPFSYRLDLIERHKRSGRILDIGCATGGFLNLARKRGWEAFGVEFSDYAADFAIKKYDLNVFKGSLEEAQFKDDDFDVISASDIIEHLNDPVDFLQEIHRILTNDGLLYLAFPNAGSFYYKFFGLIARYNYRNYFLLPYHLYHFSPSTIKPLLNKTGFGIVQLKFSHSRSPSLFMNIFNFRDRILVIAKKTA